MSVVQDKYRRTDEYVRVLAELVQAAEFRGVTTYQDIALIMGLPQRGSHMGREVGHLLGEVSEDETQAGRPMLSAVAVGVSGSPGPGFFALARDLGRLDADGDETAFWQAERQAAYDAWRRPLPGAEAAQQGAAADTASPRR